MNEQAVRNNQQNWGLVTSTANAFRRYGGRLLVTGLAVGATFLLETDANATQKEVSDKPAVVSVQKPQLIKTELSKASINALWIFCGIILVCKVVGKIFLETKRERNNADISRLAAPYSASIEEALSSKDPYFGMKRWNATPKDVRDKINSLSHNNYQIDLALRKDEYTPPTSGK